MQKIFIVLFILFFSITETFAYAIKVYDQWGNRIGTYKKEGESFVLYDFNDRKVEKPSDLIKNPPTQETLTDYTQYFYNENMEPIGSYTSGLWSNTGAYYPRGRFIPWGFYPYPNPYIVRPSGNTYIYEKKYPYFNNQRNGSSTNVIRTFNGVRY